MSGNSKLFNLVISDEYDRCVCPPPTSDIDTTTQTPLELAGEVCQCPYSEAVPNPGQFNLVLDSSNSFCSCPSTELTNPNVQSNIIWNSATRFCECPKGSLASVQGTHLLFSVDDGFCYCPTAILNDPMTESLLEYNAVSLNCECPRSSTPLSSIQTSLLFNSTTKYCRCPILNNYDIYQTYPLYYDTLSTCQCPQPLSYNRATETFLSWNPSTNAC